MIILEEPNTQTCDVLFAWVSVDEGGEGIIAAYMDRERAWMPLVTSNGDLARTGMREIAKDVAAKKPVRLLRFTRAEIVEEIK